MSENERHALEEEAFLIKLLLDFHTTNRKRTTMSESEFEAYVNAALDRLLEIRNLLSPSEEEQP